VDYGPGFVGRIPAGYATFPAEGSPSVDPSGRSPESHDQSGRDVLPDIASPDLHARHRGVVDKLSHRNFQDASPLRPGGGGGRRHAAAKNTGDKHRSARRADGGGRPGGSATDVSAAKKRNRTHPSGMHEPAQPAARPFDESQLRNTYNVGSKQAGAKRRKGHASSAHAREAGQRGGGGAPSGNPRPGAPSSEAHAGPSPAALGALGASRDPRNAKTRSAEDAGYSEDEFEEDADTRPGGPGARPGVRPGLVGTDTKADDEDNYSDEAFEPQLNEGDVEAGRLKFGGSLSNYFPAAVEKVDSPAQKRGRKGCDEVGMPKSGL